MEIKKNFINLTNGIQAIKDYDLKEFNFIRLQSTACEQKRWEDIILMISDDFLMSVALGYNCIVYDYGANKEVPRAVWQGLEWIKYVLHRRWNEQDYKPEGRARTSEKYFSEQYFKLSKRAKARLDYFRRYKVGDIKISAVTNTTKNDGNSQLYVKILRDFVDGTGEK